MPLLRPLLALVALCLAGAAQAADLTVVIRDGNDRPVEDAVVIADAAGHPAPSPGRFVINQSNMQFVPHVLVIPVGGSHLQHLEVWHRLPGDRWRHERRGECRFVPLVGRDAWRERPESGT